MNAVVSGHLDVAGNPDLIEAGQVVALLKELRRTNLRILGVSKFPHAVKRLRERHVAIAAALLAVIIQMIAVGVDLTDAEYARIVEPLDIGLHTCYLPLVMRVQTPIHIYYTLRRRQV